MHSMAHKLHYLPAHSPVLVSHLGIAASVHSVSIVQPAAGAKFQKGIVEIDK